MYNISDIDNYTKDEILESIGYEYSDCNLETLKIILATYLKMYNMIEDNFTTIVSQYNKWDLERDNTNNKYNTNNTNNISNIYYISSKNSFMYNYGLEDIATILLSDMVSRRNIKI